MLCYNSQRRGKTSRDDHTCSAWSWAPLPEQHGHTETSTEKHHKDYEKVGAPLLRGQAERAGTVQHEEEKAGADVIKMHEYLMVRKMQADSPQMCLVTGQDVMGTNRQTGISI